MNSLSLSNVINLGMLWSLISLSSSTNANCSALYFSLKGSIMVYFVSLFIMTMMALYTSAIIGSLDFSNLVMKSIIILSYGVFSTGANCIFLYSLYLTDLFC